MVCSQLRARREVKKSLSNCTVAISKKGCLAKKSKATHSSLSIETRPKGAQDISDK